LKFARDRRRYLRWLFEAKKRYGLCVLNYAITSNHVHLLVRDRGGDKDVIPKSIQLIAGRTGQEYNNRKNRKGAYWEDRYHATAVEAGEHLARCLVYIDLNMVRAGVVKHPSEWEFNGYNEIQTPRKRYSLIDHERLKNLFGFSSIPDLAEAHRRWVNEAIQKEEHFRDGTWTESIAVGSKSYIEAAKTKLGVKAKGRGVFGQRGNWSLRESQTPYEGNLEPENEDLRLQNEYLWKYIA